MKDLRVGDFVNVIATGAVKGVLEDTNGGKFYIVQFGDQRFYSGNFNRDQIVEVDDDTTTD